MLNSHQMNITLVDIQSALVNQWTYAVYMYYVSVYIETLFWLFYISNWETNEKNNENHKSIYSAWIEESIVWRRKWNQEFVSQRGTTVGLYLSPFCLLALFKELGGSHYSYLEWSGVRSWGEHCQVLPSWLAISHLDQPSVLKQEVSKWLYQGVKYEFTIHRKRNIPRRSMNLCTGSKWQS